MLNENLKTLRKQRGLSQQELAVRLHVVRQTVSKWEKGLSVPDADTLIRIAEILEVSVETLLGGKMSDSEDSEGGKSSSEIAKQLTQINEQLAIRNRRTKIVLKVVGILLLLFFVFTLLQIVVGVISFEQVQTHTRVDVQEVSG
ncbi:MAG TPA: helix-turn-helix transcriptional regulator [Candidatus Limivivens intestinipullorum]|uniref:Helix-turn-helix transcriptional regulator n=1 Tax=Candidatus Limivivens intestinipullorum TaxID=2840858 RepID=A0A9D1EVG2_9FIRM|nr:helix-turn-helix transcriptional regulator [Candidatus Limivivens intestinipullorum]